MAHSDPPEVLNPPERRFDGVSVPIEDRREAVFPEAIALGRNVGRHAKVFDLPPHGIAVLAPVSVKHGRLGDVVEQVGGGRTIRYVAPGQ
jgi:hypothetical protein